MLSTLILLPYFERPRLVRNALTSILRESTSWGHWHLAFIDDGSLTPGEPIVREILAEQLDKVSFYQVPDSAQDKIRQGGSRHGAYMNLAIADSACDLGIVLCDDDELHPGYLRRLSDYFEIHPGVPCCYSKVIAYNPLIQSSAEATGLPYGPNAASGLINGCCLVDASQVAWRLSCCQQRGVWFDPCRGSSLDADFYEKLFHTIGPLHPTDFIAQYKGLHARQLGEVREVQAWTQPGILDKETP